MLSINSDYIDYDDTHLMPASWYTSKEISSVDAAGTQYKEKVVTDVSLEETQLN